MNPLATPASTTPLRPSPKRPELAKPEHSNPYEVLTEEDDAEISKLSSELNEDPTVLKDILEHLNLVHNGKFTQKASRETDWTIDTFIRHNLPFYINKK